MANCKGQSACTPAVSQKAGTNPQTERAKLERHLAADFQRFVAAAFRVLLEFIYDTVERGRRRALREMLSLCEDAVRGDTDRVVRERLLRYLETTYSQEIEDIIGETGRYERLMRLVDGKVESTDGEVLGGIRSPREAQEIRGQAARFLGSYPDFLEKTQNLTQQSHKLIATINEIGSAKIFTQLESIQFASAESAKRDAKRSLLLAIGLGLLVVMQIVTLIQLRKRS